MRVDADRLAGAGRAGDQQVGHRREIGHVRLAVNRLAERDASASTSTAGRRPTRAARAARSARALRFGIWMPTVDLPGMRSISTDSACIARHRSSARPVIFEYFTPASGLNSKVVTTGPGMDLDDRAFDRELAALLLEQPRAVHQLALVDLALGPAARRAAPAAAACSRPCAARPAPSRSAPDRTAAAAATAW